MDIMGPNPICSTTAFLDDRVQIFQTHYSSHDCYKCDPNEPYQFFSHNAKKMMQFSSVWFTGEENSHKEVETTPEIITLYDSYDQGLPTKAKKEETNKTISKFQNLMTEIEYSKKIPLLPTYGQNEVTKYPTEKKTNRSRRFVKGREDPLWCQLARKKEQPFQIGKKFMTEHPLTIRLPSYLPRIIPAVKFAPFQTKVAISKFGRQRKVLDFSHVETMYDNV